MNFEQTSKREDSLIPNTSTEKWFMRIAKGEQVAKYVELAEKGHIGLATAIAENVQNPCIEYLISDWELKHNQPIENWKEVRQKEYDAQKMVWNEEAKRHIMPKVSKPKKNGQLKRA